MAKLSQTLENTINKLGSGDLKANEFKGTLIHVHEQVLTLETELEQKTKKIIEQEKWITTLELERHNYDRKAKEGQLESLTDKVILQFFNASDDGILHSTDIARLLKEKNSVIRYHCDKLLAAGMIDMVGVDAHYITLKGRAYVMERNLDNAT